MKEGGRGLTRDLHPFRVEEVLLKTNTIRTRPEVTRGPDPIYPPIFLHRRLIFVDDEKT